MALLRSAVLYTALTLIANAAAAQGIDRAALDALRQGDMEKLALADTPTAVPDTVFFAPDGTERRLTEWKGKVTVVNFWATWCAPCRKEMPSLDRLQAALGGDAFDVVTIATGRNSPAGIDRFFSETGLTALPRFTDPGQDLARAMAVMGLPVTVVIDREGREVGRLLGGAEWDAPEAVALLSALKG
ncbi:MAG: TlpA family protein disulfide reductase [Pseudomonadota bacterium]